MRDVINVGRVDRLGAGCVELLDRGGSVCFVDGTFGRNGGEIRDPIGSPRISK